MLYFLAGCFVLLLGVLLGTWMFVRRLMYIANKHERLEKPIIEILDKINKGR